MSLKGGICWLMGQVIIQTFAYRTEDRARMNVVKCLLLTIRTTNLNMLPITDVDLFAAGSRWPYDYQLASRIAARSMGTC